MTKRPSNTKSSMVGDRNSARPESVGSRWDWQNNRIRILYQVLGAQGSESCCLIPWRQQRLLHFPMACSWNGKLTVSQPDGTSIIILSTNKPLELVFFRYNTGEKVEIRQPDTNSLMLGRVTGGSDSIRALVCEWWSDLINLMEC